MVTIRPTDYLLSQILVYQLVTCLSKKYCNLQRKKNDALSSSL